VEDIVICLKIALVFCGIALLLGLLGDLSLILLVRATGGVGVFANSASALDRAMLFVLSVAWISVTLIGWLVARRLNLIPGL
jgi:hypothetical protein